MKYSTYLLLILLFSSLFAFSQQNGQFYFYSEGGDMFKVEINKTNVTQNWVYEYRTELLEHKAQKIKIYFKNDSSSIISETFYPKTGKCINYEVNITNNPKILLIKEEDILIENKDENFKNKSENNIDIENSKTCKEPMTEYEFKIFKKKLEEVEFETQRLKFLKEAIYSECVDSHQARSIVGLFDLDKYRLACAKLIYLYTSDRENFSMVFDVFDQQKTIKEFELYVKSLHGKMK